MIVNTAAVYKFQRDEKFGQVFGPYADGEDKGNRFIEEELVSGQSIAGLGKTLQVGVDDSDQGGAKIGDRFAGVGVDIGELFGKRPLLQAFSGPLREIVGIFQDVFLQEILVGMVKPSGWRPFCPST